MCVRTPSCALIHDTHTPICSNVDTSGHCGNGGIHVGKFTIAFRFSGKPTSKFGKPCPLQLICMTIWICLQASMVCASPFLRSSTAPVNHSARPHPICHVVYLPLAGYIECEPPNNRLHKFVGTLQYNGQQYSLDNEKIVLRVRGKPKFWRTQQPVDLLHSTQPHRTIIHTHTNTHTLTHTLTHIHTHTLTHIH